MKKKIVPMVLCMLLIACMIMKPVIADAAMQQMTVDKKEYNLHIEDIPSFTSEWDSIFAKLNNVSDSSAYALSLFDDTDSSDVLMKGLEKIKVTADPDDVYGIDIMIYKLDSDGEYYPAENATDCTIICPVPDFWLDTPDKLSLYNVNSSGKAQETKFDLVKVGSVPCMKFDIKSTGVYGFVFNAPETESNNDSNEPKPTKAPTKAPAKPNTEATVPSYDTETKPTSVPSAKPTNAPVNNSTTGSNQTANQPSKENQNVVSQTTDKIHKLDSTPQTGDDFAPEVWMVTAGLSASAIMGILFLLKHKH